MVRAERGAILSVSQSDGHKAGRKGGKDMSMNITKESPAEINRKKRRLIEAIVTSQTFRNYNIICQDDVKEETIDAEKVLKRRERFVKKILLQTSLCGLPVAFAEEVCYTLLCAVEEGIT